MEQLLCELSARNLGDLVGGEPTGVAPASSTALTEHAAQGLAPSMRR